MHDVLMPAELWSEID